MANYIPNTTEQQQAMAKDIGIDSIEDLFASIPEDVCLKKKLSLPKAMSEMEIIGYMNELAGRNKNTCDYTCFLGAGAYDHFVPSVIGHLLSRQEFYTAYTPYQPEISQGTLQAIFEYQSMICSLTGMDVANASMYDGATALAEAASMVCQATRRNEVLIAKSVHPESREVLKTYARFNKIKVIEYGYDNGAIDIADIKSKISDETAAVIIQTPNFFGIIEDLSEAAEIAHANKSLLVASCDPISLGLLKSPGQMGADIVIGEGQPLSSALSYGGPYLGFFAAKEQLLRKMPGRIVGQTVDKDGKRGYVLTIQTREQHIRREKATSNICSNQSLCALAATIYLTAMGKQGLKKVASDCLSKSRYAYEKLIDIGAFSSVFEAPFFKEFVVKYKGDITQLNKKLLEYKILGGYDLGRDYTDLNNCWLVAVTEKRTKKEIDSFIDKAAAI